MEYPIKFQKLFLIGKRKWLFVVAVVAITFFLCQSLMLPYGNALHSLLPIHESPKERFSSRQSYAKSLKVGGSLIVDTWDSIGMSLFDGQSENEEKYNMGGDIEVDRGTMGTNSNSTLEDKGLDNDVDFVEDTNIDNEFPLEENTNIDDVIEVTNVKAQDDILMKPGSGILMENITSLVGSPMVDSLINMTFVKNPKVLLSTSRDSTLNKSSIAEGIELFRKDEDHLLLQSDFAASINDSEVTTKVRNKIMRTNMPPKSVTTLYQMNRLLVRHRRSSRAMRRGWASPRDLEIVAAKLQIENAISVKNERELFSPLFRNVSMFKRSYELMEQMLKVYVYKDGEKPIFHQPILKGLYASEGWFMKLMEGNKHFVVKDPRKAHLFYMPFSSRMLEYSLYVRNSHNRTNLRQYLKNYAEKIAAKYPFWNRTGGTDHFLVACHDWAPYETRHHMEHCIKSLCNADVTTGFKIGRDVSLPETYVRSTRNPLRDLGGKTPSDRHILAFYAGNMHGYFRPILLKHWKDRDPDMKILGPMPPGLARKMTYIQHMKSSKYCICPKGYEVNSPRVVEAIFYECVPVIISDNFVPPFFEVLNWDAFSVILPEKDIGRLKEILLSISEEKYVEMQLGVRKAQKHFLWHAKPVKYDLFHMTLHSIWYNRVFQIKTR
ncbi:hypothetical protein LguiA_005016 [Lonicera macranthoides]